MIFSYLKPCHLHRMTAVAAAAICIVGLAARPSAANAATPTGMTPTRLAVVDCNAELVDIDLVLAKVLGRRSLRDVLPVPAQPEACVLNSPYLEDGKLAFEMSSRSIDGEDFRYRHVQFDLSTGQVVRISDEHVLPDQTFADPIVNEIANGDTLAGKAFAPFSRPAEHGGRYVDVDAEARLGRFVLARLVDVPPGTSAFAVVDMQTKSVRVVKEAPQAYYSQMHLSSSGRSVLIEVSATPTVHGSRAPMERSGRVVQVDVDTGRITRQQIIPMLKADGADPRVLCFSDDGQIVIGARNTHRLWLIQGAKTTQLDVANDVSSDCFFSGSPR